MMSVVIEWRAAANSMGFTWKVSTHYTSFVFDAQSTKHISRQLLDHLIAERAKSAFVIYKYDYRIRDNLNDVTFYFISSDQLRELVDLNKKSFNKKIEIGI